MQPKFSKASCALAAVLGVAVLSGGASAAPAPIDTSKVQALATQIETALMQLGCGAPPPAVEAPPPPQAVMPPPPPPMRGERGALDVKPVFLRAAYTTVSAPTVQQDVAAIEETIAASGVSPSEAAAALSVVQSYQGLCGNQSVAVASVSQSIELALATPGPAAGPGGAPGGPTPIGPPAVYVGGGGSNYVTP